MDVDQIDNYCDLWDGESQVLARLGQSMDAQRVYGNDYIRTLFPQEVAQRRSGQWGDDLDQAVRLLWTLRQVPHELPQALAVLDDGIIQFPDPAEGKG
jgi:hypothetical protein